MKKVIYVLAAVVLLAACQPDPKAAPTEATASPIEQAAPATATEPVITETLAESIAQITAIWCHQTGGGFWEIKKGASANEVIFNSYSTEADPWEIFAKGAMEFEAGKLTILTDSGCAADTERATYEIYLVKEDGHVIAMRMKLVGDDPCLDRKAVMDNTYFQNTGRLFFIQKHLP